MESLWEIHEQLIVELEPVYFRNIVKISEGRVITGLVGSRGVGKTTFMLDHIKKNYPVSSRKALYVSADNIYFSENTLFELARQFKNESGGELLCIDEIHRYANWAQELKNIFDSFPNLRIVFSGSSSINIIEQKYDLSRRVIVNYVPGFSFREWLEFNGIGEFGTLTLDQILDKEFTIPEEITKTPGILGLFKEYLRSGYYPIRKTLATNEEFFLALMNTVDKIIFADIASYYSLKTTSLDSFKKILYFVATSPPSKINTNSIGQSLKKHHQDIASYLDMMRNTSLLRYLLIDRLGHAMIRNAEKVYLDNSNLNYAICNFVGKSVDVGSIREVFAINQLENSGNKVFYSKVGDLAVNEFSFEIGGSGKSFKQLEGAANGYILKDDIVYKSGNVIPLYMLGFLY